MQETRRSKQPAPPSIGRARRQALNRMQNSKSPNCRRWRQTQLSPARKTMQARTLTRSAMSVKLRQEEPNTGDPFWATQRNMMNMATGETWLHLNLPPPPLPSHVDDREATGEGRKGAERWIFLFFRLPFTKAFIGQDWAYAYGRYRQWLRRRPPSGELPLRSLWLFASVFLIWMLDPGLIQSHCLLRYSKKAPIGSIIAV